MLGSVVANLSVVVAAALWPGASAPVRALETGWRHFEPTGIPAGAGIQSVAAGPGGFVAVGSTPSVGDELTSFAVWHSTDGIAWREVHRSTASFSYAHVAAAGPGFAAFTVLCWYPDSDDSQPDDPNCESNPVVSPDGVTWEPATLEPSERGVAAPSTMVADVTSGPDGELVAVGWVAYTRGERNPASWRSDDGGRSWTASSVAIPSNADKPDEMRAVGSVAGGWLATGIDELERRGSRTFYMSQREPRMWESPDGRSWRRVDPPEGASSVDLVTSGGGVRYVSGGSAGGVSIWRAVPGEPWSSTARGFPNGEPNSLSVLEGDADGLVLGGLEPQPDGRKRPVLWGSADGRSYRRTLTAGDRVWFRIAVRSGDRWFVYGTSSNPVGGSTNHGWVASVSCATGRTCSDPTGVANPGTLG